MPLTAKDQEIEENAKKEYKQTNGESLFFNSRNSAPVGRADNNVMRNFNDVVSGSNSGK
jgi:hypothetical protein